MSNLLRKPACQIGLAVGQNIAKFRKQKQLKQRELAKLVSVDTATVGRWETGANIISLKSLARVSTVLDTPIREFLPGKI